MMFWYGGGWAWWQAWLMWLAMIAFWVLLIWAAYGGDRRGAGSRERAMTALPAGGPAAWEDHAMYRPRPAGTAQEAQTGTAQEAQTGTAQEAQK